VPDVVAFDIEGGFDECDGTGVADDCVFASCFTGFGGLNGSRVGLGSGCIRDSSDDFELYLVQVYGVGIFGEVVNLPCFAGTQPGFFGGRVHPAHGHGHIHFHIGVVLHGAKHAGHRAIEVPAGF